MPRRRKDLVFEESLFNNMEDYYNFENRLIDLCVGAHGFENVPKEIYLPYVIRLLIFENECLFFKDEDLDRYIMYQFTNDGGKLDEYMRPINRRVVIPQNGYNRIFNRDNSVILKGSMSGTPIYPIIKQYARKLYICSRTIDINIQAQKTPIAVRCDENERLTYKNLINEYVGNAPLIFGTKNLDLNNVQTIDLKAPFVADKIYQIQSNLWNEFLTFLGISNVNLDKKAQIISDEVSRSMGGVLIARNNYVSSIQRGIDEINEMFGLDIKFNWGEQIAIADEENYNEVSEVKEVNINE